MRRTLQCLTLITLAPLLIGAGGQNPPGFVPQIVGPTFTATIQLDPHMAAGDDLNQLGSDVTTTAKQASIRLVGTGPKKKDPPTVSQAEFQAMPGFVLYRGCDLGLVPGPNIPRTELRFLYSPTFPNTLGDWVPPASLQFLFAPQGVTVSSTMIPAITAINRAECISDPRNLGPIANGGDGDPSVPGILLMDVTIQFLVPAP